MDATRALLDELMGNDRDIHPSEKKRKDLKFDDAEICKYYICSFCPHELFTNTKSDLGPCPKIHYDVCKQEWQIFDKKYRYSFEGDFIRFLERLINDLDRRIKRGHERLDHQDDEPNMPVTVENKEKIESINQRCDEIVKQIEELGEEGRVEEANALMKTLEGLKQEKEALLRSNEVKAISSQERRMRVCEICGAFLVIGDTEKRTASHLEGKQHQGYHLIRETLKDYYKRKEDERRQRRTDIRRTSQEQTREPERRISREQRSPRDRRSTSSKEDEHGGIREREPRRPGRRRSRSRSRSKERDGHLKKRQRRSAEFTL